jgi:hypothetical protein
MTCEWVKMPSGGMAMVCGPRQRRRKCYVRGCPTPASFQCDFPIGRGTCDRHVCAAHRSAQSLPLARTGGSGIDFCPEHGRQPALPHFDGAS